jgi:hypothetical protein
MLVVRARHRLERAGSIGLTVQPFCLYGLWLPANSNSQSFLHMDATDSNDPFFGITGSAAMVVAADGGSGINTAMTRGEWRMVGGGFNDASSWVVVDGATRVTGDAGPGVSNNNDVVMGAITNESGFFLNGDVYTLFGVSGAVSQADEDRIFGWMAAEGALQANLPSAHPYKYRAPGAATKTGLRFCIGFGLRQRTLR